jgi:hypothetical protein
MGDRIIQLKNDYDREVFNGDLGIIASIDPIEQEARIDFDGREVTYDYADLNEITLAWSITIQIKSYSVRQCDRQQRYTRLKERVEVKRIGGGQLSPHTMRSIAGDDSAR